MSLVKIDVTEITARWNSIANVTNPESAANDDSSAMLACCSTRNSSKFDLLLSEMQRKSFLLWYR